MIKFMTGLSRVLLIAALASGFTLYFTWTIVSTYVDRLIEQFNLPIEGQLVGFSDLVGAVTEDLEQLSNRSGSGGGDSHTTPGEGSEPSSPPKDATAVFGQGIEEQDAEKELVYSSNDLAEKKDQLNQQDRLEIFNFLSALSAEELNEISELMEGGVTEEEMLTIQEMVKQSISAEDFQKLMEILEKY
ncbi:hypothetical protein [Paenibacillus senegalensis]|uniref:hypothetical protein n=1 Tax=Paenibacillus senegalensis TaxID=1465766 RepID=UPI000288EE03|nr:hypothetical protein [Paenibacillus senegalensis]